MEALVNFFSKTKVRRKNRAARHSWAFFQLRSFVEYKAQREGVPLRLIHPAYSSQECSVCHYIDKRNRPSQEKFQCRNFDPACGHSDNADFNSAKILKYRAEVNLPIAAATEDSDLSVGRENFVLPKPAASPGL